VPEYFPGGACVQTKRLGVGESFSGDGDVHPAEQLVDEFDLLPPPGSLPTTGAFPAITSSNGCTAASAVSEPLTMINRSPCPALAAPPETGASTICTPVAASRRAQSSTAAGPTVAISSTTLPGLSVAAPLPSP